MGIAQTADEYEASKSDPNEIWIKGFKEGETRIRFLIEPEQAKTYLEHYAEGFGYFPCNRGKDCVGCTDESAKVRQKGRKWIYQALNDRGHQQLYKFGNKLHEQLKMRKNRVEAKTLKDRDYLIIRTGRNFNEISYNYEPGEIYPVQFDGQLLDSDAVLEAKYREAAAAYGVRVVSEQPAPAEPQAWSLQTTPQVPVPTPSDPWMPPQQPVAQSTQWPAQPDEAQTSVVPEQPRSNGQVPEKMSTAELRDLLTAKSTDFPKNAPRSRLVKLADEVLAANPPS